MFDNIKIKVIGEKDNVPKDVAEGIEKIVEKTKNNTGLTLNIAFNYGGRAESDQRDPGLYRQRPV